MNKTTKSIAAIVLLAAASAGFAQSGTGVGPVKMTIGPRVNSDLYVSPGSRDKSFTLTNFTISNIGGLFWMMPAMPLTVTQQAPLGYLKMIAPSKTNWPSSVVFSFTATIGGNTITGTSDPISLDSNGNITTAFSKIYYSNANAACELTLDPASGSNVASMSINCGDA